MVDTPVPTDLHGTLELPPPAALLTPDFMGGTGWLRAFLMGTFDNKFRNGTMDVAQRGTSGTVASATSAYTLDGWLILPTGATAAWSQQYSANLAGNALRIACATGMTACNLSQRIESVIASQLLTFNKNAQAVTVQFAIFNSTGAAITPQIRTSFATARDNFSSVTTDVAATNLQTIINGTSGVFAYTFVPNSTFTGNGYQVDLLFGGALNAASGFVDISFADIRSTSGAAVGMTSGPPSPELRPVAAEQSFCDRYYTTGNFDLLGTATGYAGNRVFFRNSMRATPSLTTTSFGGGNVSGLTLDLITPGGFRAFTNAVGTIGVAANGDGTFTATAEL
jgi:hypothetical protein